MTAANAATAQPPVLRPAHVAVHLLRHRIAQPVRTSFGTMHARPALLVRIDDADGAHGWGEIWCNFPACGAEHRARLVESVLAPLLVGAQFASPADAFERLTQATAVLAIQSGEPGPFAQAIAGLDLALWDLAARRAGVPLWQLLGGQGDEIGVYASGINPERPEDVVARKRAEGFRAFKLKIGFDEARDLDNLRRMRDAAGGDAALMADANQAWDLPTAIARVRALGDSGLRWIEEPLRADRPWSDWLALRAHAPAPLAAGENVAGAAAFDALLDAGAVSVVQPDVAKWGGHSGTLPVARRILARGRRLCPHYLGAGIGLLHSAHLLAAAGGDGWLEIDANENPLRSRLCGPLNQVDAGRCRLGTLPGIGVEPEPAWLGDPALR
jgi:L-alanine-DL-glutamate epimerase-like enolase superfamily enzyme